LSDGRGLPLPYAENMRTKGACNLDDKSKKQIPLRLSASLWKELAAWAEEDFRSLNGQIEYLLNECLKRRKKGIGNRE